MKQITKSIKICLISSGHLSSNPRLVKEIFALRNSYFKVSVIYVQTLKYLIEHDSAIERLLPEIKFYTLNITGNSFFSSLRRFKYSFLKQLSKKKITGNNLKINPYYYHQFSLATKIKADLYIGHNLPSLPIVVNAARRNKTKCGFDAEDFHRFENYDDRNNSEVILNTIIEDKYFSSLSYVTAASPMIADAYQSLYQKNVSSILNVFPKTDIKPKLHSNETLRFFWFSQTIGTNRGLEEIILSLNKLINVELHLLGELTSSNKVYFDNFCTANQIKSELIHYHHPILASEIIPFAQQFDIGLATETGIPFNRDICLTNKIFTYNQAGLAILASNTIAQVALLAQYPNMGLIYERNNHFDLEIKLNELLSDSKQLLKYKKHSFLYGSTVLNWEKEGFKFLSIVENTLKN